MTALAKIKQAGFTLALLPDGNLKVTPFSQLTQQQRDYLTTHKTEIIAELKAANDAISPMEQWQRAAVSAWVKSLGGSDAEIQEEIQETIQQCETSMEARLYFLKRATGLLPPKQTVSVKCMDCRHFKRYEGYGKSTAGECLQKVMPMGMVHYGDTPKRCGKFEA